MEKERLLQKLGLTKLESKMYLILLELNASTAGEVTKKLMIQRSTAYYVLENLQKKGLVIFSFKGKRKLFQAASPHILEKYAQETYQEIKKAIPELLKPKEKEEKDEALMFTGYKGLQAAYEQMINESKEGDEYLIMGARGGEDISNKTYSAFYKNFNKRRIEQKINQRVIMNKELKAQVGKFYEGLKRTKIRYLNQKTLVPVVVFSNAIAIIQWKKEPSLFLLRGKEVVGSFKQYFESIWKVSK